MSVLTMNMSGYEIQRNAEREAEYGEAVLNAGWVPRLAQQEILTQQWENQHSLPDDLANVDIEVFLRKMYKSQF